MIILSTSGKGMGYSAIVFVLAKMNLISHLGCHITTYLQTLQTTFLSLVQYRIQTTGIWMRFLVLLHIFIKMLKNETGTLWCWQAAEPEYHRAWKPQHHQSRSDQLPSCDRLFVTPWIAARQASLSITKSRSSLRLTSVESVMPSSHLILCRPLLLLSPIPPSIRVFSNESTLCMETNKTREFCRN